MRSAVKAGSRVGLCPHVHPEACLCNRREAPTQPATLEHGQHPPFPSRTSHEALDLSAIAVTLCAANPCQLRVTTLCGQARPRTLLCCFVCPCMLLPCALPQSQPGKRQEVSQEMNCCPG